MRQETYSPGSMIIEEATVGDCAYLIEEGRVEVSVCWGERRVVLAVLGPGDIFGEMALIGNGVRTATVTALDTTVVNRIDKDYFHETIAPTDPIVSTLIQVVMERFSETRNKLFLREPLGLDDIILEAARNNSQPDKNRNDNVSAAIERIRSINDLHSALENNEFQLYYQPIVDLKTHTVAGFEALLRWFHPVRGEICPSDFVPLAEDTKMIIPLGRWIFEEACASLNAFRAAAGCDGGDRAPWMSINISAVQFHDKELIKRFEKTLSKLNLPRDSVKIELTERVLADNAETTLAFLEELQKLGLKISLDDFGTGYSSLNYLHSFPVHCVKIDQSFVHALLKNPRSLKIIQGLTSLLNSLDMDCIAEGVECKEQAETLSQLGCQYVQGYCFGKPMPFTAALALLQS